MTAPKQESTALAKLDQSADAASAGAALTIGQRKAFLEVAARTDLDRLSAEQQRATLIAFGQHTGLRPELGEVIIYQGRFYVTMLGRIRNAHRLGLFEGIQAKPANLIQRKNGGYEDGDLVWICEVFRKGASRGFMGWGKVTAAEIATARAGDKTRFTPVAKHPVEMARKRAEYDALRLAFPLDEELSEISRRFIEAAEAEVEDPTTAIAGELPAAEAERETGEADGAAEASA